MKDCNILQFFFQKSFIFNLSRRNEDICHVININMYVSNIFLTDLTEPLFMVVSCAVSCCPASTVLDKTKSSR